LTVQGSVIFSTALCKNQSQDFLCLDGTLSLQLPLLSSVRELKRPVVSLGAIGERRAIFLSKVCPVYGACCGRVLLQKKGGFHMGGGILRIWDGSW